MLAAMRGLRIPALAASIACLGAAAACSFRSPDASTDAPGIDGATDAEYAPACLTDPAYVANPTTGRRYRLGPASINYDTAIDLCTAGGAHLAAVNDAAENTYLAGLLPGGEGWIGYDDLTQEGTFTWVTGATSPYENFTGPDPNNTNNEDCTGLRADKSWHDAGCEDSRRPICECDPAYHPPPTPICRSMTANGFEASGRRVLRRPAATYADAKAGCEAIGAHLLVIGDIAENVEMDMQLAGPFWIGYTDLATEATFRWDNGAMSTYKNWVGGVVPTVDALDCAVLQDGGLWSNVDCATTNPSACECDPAPP